VTLHADVAALLRDAARLRRMSLEQVANEALREGLRRLATQPARRGPYRTPAVSLGRCLVGSVDEVAAVLARAGGQRRP